MDSRLKNLITDYQKSVHDALVLMRRSGIKMPHSSNSWMDTNLSRISSLIGGIPYYKHGAGCQVELAGGKVDFDFGEHGEISGLDAWRLAQFANKSYESYGFLKKEEIRECFTHAVEKKKLIQKNHKLYYIAGEPLIYASSIDSRKKTDLLPHKENDEILTLYIHYFYAADLMHKNYESLSSELKQKNNLTSDQEINLRIYMTTWLGFLAVSCDELKKLRIRDLLENKRPSEFKDLISVFNKLHSEINEHWDHLRKFRNNVFHMRKSLEDTLTFFEPGKDRLAWAHSIHGSIDNFLSHYRIICQSYYMIHNRICDIDFR